ncbi:C1q-related factor-like [Mercenaria mercenaria]|uniref:C1q-related factor-like n=1 Tax=Mercenaria mercenaria TaxID=6596 RepID=UPI001E1D5F0A|nr:C1q-related factor-like [Mercenaria mercenaria]
MFKTLLILFFVWNPCSVIGSEPVCSRFHYEEQTLEKMIRQEILIEKIKAEMDVTKQEVLDALSDLKNERQAMESLKDEMKGSAIKRTVAFKAQVVSDKAMSDGKVIVFSETLLNQGDAYDKASGIFVAPVGGTYLFTTQICLGIGTRSYFGISLNGNIISKSLLGDNVWEKCYTLDTVATVKTGDKVAVKCTASCRGDSLWENSQAISSFSGILIP